MEQLTKEQAIEFHDSKAYESMTDRQKAEFQMGQKLLCMPFDVFHEAITNALGRDVYTHEFGLNYEGIKAELFDGAESLALVDIINQIPEEKRMVVAL